MRISLRDKIFREAVANSLIHREYSSAYVAKMIIENGKVVFENPNIAKVFREIGFADELGSGVKNLYKYSKAYGGSDPVIVEGEVFRIEVQIQLETTKEIKKLSTKERVLEELEKNNRLTRDGLSQLIGVSTEAIKQHLSNLKKEGKLKRVGSTKSGYWEVMNHVSF